MYEVVVTGTLFPEVEKQLRNFCNLRIWQEPCPIPQDILYQWLQTAAGLYSTGIPITAELLANAPKLRVIAQSSVGYDNIDVAACTKRNIPVGNTPGVLIEATADLAFGLVLSAARKIHEGWVFVKEGRWNPTSRLTYGVDLYGKTLGIVGLGQIGTAAAKRAQASGMKVIYHNRHPRPDDTKLGVIYASFDQLLADSDFILLLLPLTPATRNLFGPAEFARMKSTAYLINAARGGIVDTQALYTALRDGQIAYAALDVTDPEPLPGDHPLLTLPNVLITPHIGSATAETRLAMARLTADNLLAGLAEKPLPACVNPEVNYR